MGIFKDAASGNYGIRVEYYGKDYKKIIGPSKTEAKFALEELKRDIRLAKLSSQKWDGFEKLRRATKPKTFGEAAQEYMDERKSCKASTLSIYKSILKVYLLPKFEKQSLDSITESTVRKFLSEVAEKSSPVRANTITQLMRSILRQAYRKGEIAKDPTLAVNRLQEPKAVIDPLTEEELSLVLTHIDKHYQPFFITLAYTGARPNELQALRWSDIDWNSDMISINKGRVRGVEGLPKTKSSERRIPMLGNVRETLKQLQSRQVHSINDYVFLDKKGKPINKHLDRIWARALKSAGMRHRPSYQLRHTFATQCIIKGFPIPFVAKLLGHSTIDTLIRHYTRWIDGATNQQIDKLRQAFQASNVTDSTGLNSKPGSISGNDLSLTILPESKTLIS